MTRTEALIQLAAGALAANECFDDLLPEQQAADAAFRTLRLLEQRHGATFSDELPTRIERNALHPWCLVLTLNGRRLDAIPLRFDLPDQAGRVSFDDEATRSLISAEVRRTAPGEGESP